LVTDLKFTSWQRTPLYDLVPTEALTDGRLVGQLPLVLTDANSGDTGNGQVAFHLVAPRDIASVQTNLVARLAPAALSRDAETTKLVHVDFNDPDLPWRYTPRKAAGDVLRPWLTLLVGTVDELQLAPAIVKILQPEVLWEHDLNQSQFWAHVQDDGATRTSRLLSPRRLREQTAYLAALVPAFDDAGAPAWDQAAGRQPAALPLFYSWQFWTGEEGDFETLATRIMPRAVGNLGRAPLAYRRDVVKEALEVRGAITSLGADADGVPEANARNDLQAYKAAVDALAATDPLGRVIIGLPDYGRPWVSDLFGTTWTSTLNADPRFRGTAGLGLWMGIDAQQDLVDACVAQLGNIHLAEKLVRDLALGLLAGGSLWTRRMPTDSARIVYTLSPLMRRLRTATSTALAAITSVPSPLEAALFSSAARRMLRRGAAQTRFMQNGFIGRRELVEIANRCPPDPPKTLPGLPHVDALAKVLAIPTIESADVLNLRPDANPDWMPHRDPPNRHHLQVDARDLRNVVAGLLPWPQRVPCAPADLDHVAQVVAAAVDPRGSNPPMRKRIASRISGFDLGALTPPEIPIGLDFPTWNVLRDNAKEWLLPGIDQLQKDSVVAMQTNPKFIDAYLLGLNTQLMNELHWRNLPVDRRSTPLLMFWGHVNFETGQREAEIQPLTKWPPATDLGDISHQVLHPGDVTGKRDLIILFRTDLFRRYPSTMVYLVKPVPTEDDALKATPDFHFTAATRSARVFLGPIFQGAITRDIVFFAFDLDPDTLDQYWLVLDEPPSELRFRGVDASDSPLAGTTPRDAGGNPPLAPDPHAAQFAKRMINHPTRVGIDGAYLKSLGLAISP
jgi:hypothetical protein